MATLRALVHLILSGRTDGRNQEAGDRSIYGSLTPTLGTHYEASKVVADDYSEETLWATGDGGMAAFEQGMIESDKDVTVKLSDGAVDAIFTVKAGIPALFGGQTITDLGGGSTADTMLDIDTVIVKRNVADGIGDAYVTLTLFA